MGTNIELVSEPVFPQDHDATISIQIEKVVWNGNAVDFDTNSVFKLNKGENLFMIFSNDKLAYLVEFLYKETGSKQHLSCRTIVELPDGDRFYSKFKKETIKDKSDLQAFLSDETITYNKRTISTVQVVFKYFLN